MSKQQHLCATLTDFDDGLGEDGVERRVERFMHVLQQHWRAELDGILQRPHVVMLLQIYHLQALQTQPPHMDAVLAAQQTLKASI
jgi:hypothetical protein